MIAAFSGCTKTEAPPVVAAPPPPPSIAIVKEQERSRHFMAVSQQLELGGTLYGYVDIDGDDRKVADKIHSLLKTFGATNPQLALAANQNYGAIFEAMGVDDVKAMGVSSVPDGTGYFRNRLFLYTPNGRTGFLAAGGGAPGHFPHLALAGADTDLYLDSDIDAPAIYAAIQKVARSVAGETGAHVLQAQLETAGTAMSFSILGFFENLKGNLAVMMRVSDTETLSMPRPGDKPIIVPKFELAACLDGVGSIVEQALAHSPRFKADTTGAIHYYRQVAAPEQGMGLYFAIDGTTVYFASTPAYLDDVLKKPDALRSEPMFKDALAHVGDTGNGLCYISPHLYKALKTLGPRNPGVGPVANFITSFTAELPTVDRPAISIRTNLPDGILIRSYQDRSMKPALAVLTVYNPITLGLLATVVYQQKARAAIPPRATMGAPTPAQPVTPDMIVKRNLRVLYSLGVNHGRLQKEADVPFAELVGPDKVVKSMPSVEGEDYSQLVVHVGQPLRVTVTGGRVIDYTPSAPRKPMVAPPSGP